MSSTYPESERVFVATPAATTLEAPAIISDSGISWAAIVAGAVAAAAVAITLLIFGAGLGLSSVSPWPHQGVSVTTFTVLAAIWLVLVQWISSAFGGYIAGRLRTKWVNLHTDEVFFRDTAHGFLAWGLATVAVAALLSFASQGAATAGAQLASNSTLTDTASTYYVDLLFRQNVAPSGSASALAPADNGSAAMVTGLSDRDTRAQATAILGENAANVSQEDNAYLVQLVSGRTGLSPNNAQLRVNTVIAREQADIVKAKQLADAARKASAQAAIYTFVSLLIGAFIASVAGAIGGRLRDTY
jgi:hypothetical protein